MRFLKPIWWKRLFAQDDEFRSVWLWSNIKCGFVATRALTMDAAITQVIKPPLFWRANKNFWTIWSKLPNESGRLFSKIFTFGIMRCFSFLAFSSSALYMTQNPLMILSSIGRLFDLNFFAAAAGSSMAAYFPIVKFSWLDHFRYGFHFYGTMVSYFKLH